MQSYERTTSLQQKVVSDTLSAVLSGLDNKEGVVTPIQQTSSSLKKEESTEDTGKDNQVGKLLKHVNIEKMDSCIINFNFQ